MVKNNINKFLSIKILMQANKNIALQLNSLSNIKKFKKDLKWHIEKNKQVKLQYN